MLKNQSGFTPLEAECPAVLPRGGMPKNKSANTRFNALGELLTGFTLIELVIVIGILAILAAVTVLVLNPAELIKQTRDSTRLSDLQTLNKALGIYQASGGQSFGAQNTVYVSIPDSSVACSNLGLPPLPSGWSYACSNSDNYRKTNGSGWIPINFTTVSFGSPLNILPIDPINTISSGNYYTYVTGGSYKLTALFESEKYAKNIMAKDGGPDPGLFEIGTDLNLANFQRGLLGYWKFDDGAGNTASDSSGLNKSGSLTAGATWATTNCKFNGCASFPNPSGGDTIAVPNNGTYNFGSANFTIMGWVKIPQPPQYGCLIFGNYPHAGNYGDLATGILDNRTNIFIVHTNLIGQTESHVYDFSSYWNQWTFIAWVKNGSNILFYANGDQKLNEPTSITYNVSLYSNYWYIVSQDWCNPLNTSWMIDEHRVYNRALSGNEIKAIYDATK